MPATPSATEIGPAEAAAAIQALLPAGYVIDHTPYPEPALADIERYTVDYTPTAVIPAGADFPTRCRARRHAERPASHRRRHRRRSRRRHHLGGVPALDRQDRRRWPAHGRGVALPVRRRRRARPHRPPPPDRC